MPVREALSPARTQRRRPGQGKCDEADAERAARAAMSGSKLGTPKSQDGWVDGVRVSVNIIFTVFTNVFSPIAPTWMRRIRQRGCAAFGV